MTTITVGVAEAHNNLSELIDQALAGTEVVIAKRSKPAVRLVPVDGAHAEPNGPRLAALAEELRRQHTTRRTDEEIAAYIKEERDSWQRSWDQ